MMSRRSFSRVAFLGTCAWCLVAACEARAETVQFTDVHPQLVGINRMNVRVSRTVNGVPESDVLIAGLRKTIEVQLQEGGLKTSEHGPFDPTLQVEVLVNSSQSSLAFAITVQLLDRCLILRTQDVYPFCVTWRMPTTSGTLPADGFYVVEERVLQLTAKFVSAWRASNAGQK